MTPYWLPDPVPLHHDGAAILAEQRGCRAESGRSGCQLHGQFRIECPVRPDGFGGQFGMRRSAAGRLVPDGEKWATRRKMQRLTRESPTALFLSFKPESVGEPGCLWRPHALITCAKRPIRRARKLGKIVYFCRGSIRFSLLRSRAGNDAYFGVLSGPGSGKYLRALGGDTRNGIPVGDSGACDRPGKQRRPTGRDSPPSPAPHAPLLYLAPGRRAGPVNLRPVLNLPAPAPAIYPTNGIAQFVRIWDIK